MFIFSLSSNYFLSNDCDPGGGFIKSKVVLIERKIFNGFFREVDYGGLINFDVFLQLKWHLCKPRVMIKGLKRSDEPPGQVIKYCGVNKSKWFWF